MTYGTSATNGNLNLYFKSSAGTLINNTFRLSAIASLNTPTAANFSHDGQYLAVKTQSSPFLLIYRWNNATGIWNKLADGNITGGPTTTGGGVAWSPDQYLAVGETGGATRLRILNKTAAETFAGCCSIDTQPAVVNYVDWSHDGLYVAVATSTTPFLTVYNRSSTTAITYWKLADPTAAAASCNQISFSKDDTSVAVGCGNSGGLNNGFSWYSLSGVTLTKRTNPSGLPVGTLQGAAWNPVSDMIAVSFGSTSPMIGFYNKSSSTTMVQWAGEPDTSTADAGKLSWSPDGRYVASGGAVSGGPVSWWLTTGVYYANITVNQCAVGALVSITSCSNVIGNLSSASVHFSAPFNSINFGNQTTNSTGFTQFSWSIPSGQAGIVGTFTVSKSGYETQSNSYAMGFDFNRTFYLSAAVVATPQATCGADNQSVLVPAQANHTITINSSTPLYYSANLSVSYPIGRVSEASTLRNDTGSYLLAIANSTGSMIESCSFAINTGSTNFSPTTPDATQISVIEGALATPINAEESTAVTSGEESIRDLGITFAAWAWDDPILIPNMWLMLFACMIIGVVMAGFKWKG
jgi:hypothetical protein